MLLWLPPDAASSGRRARVYGRAPVPGGWVDGNIYSQADVADKYGNQTHLVVFVRDHNIFGFLVLKKKTHLRGEKEACQNQRDKRSGGKGWRLR